MAITNAQGVARFPDLPLGSVTARAFRSAGGLAGRGTFGKLKGALQLGLGVLQARRLLKSLRGDVVVGFGLTVMKPKTA